MSVKCQKTPVTEIQHSAQIVVNVMMCHGCCLDDVGVEAVEPYLFEQRVQMKK